MLRHTPLTQLHPQHRLCGGRREDWQPGRHRGAARAGLSPYLPPPRTRADARARTRWRAQTRALSRGRGRCPSCSLSLPHSLSLPLSLSLSLSLALSLISCRCTSRCWARTCLTSSKPSTPTLAVTSPCGTPSGSTPAGPCMSCSTSTDSAQYLSWPLIGLVLYCFARLSRFSTVLSSNGRFLYWNTVLLAACRCRYFEPAGSRCVPLGKVCAPAISM